MKKASTARRSSGQKSKNTTQKRQSNSGSRQTNSGRSGEDNSRRSGSSSRTAARMQHERPANMRPASGTMERSASRSGRPTANRFQPASGQYLEKFFLDQLKDIYYAEQKIVQSLPKMIEATTTDELREAFEDHLHQTQRHVRRLEKVFEVLGQKAEGKKCEAIEGIAREAEQIIRETEENTMTRDAALIMAAQKVEHYEIASYGGLVQLAITMGQYEAAEILDRTLMEEEDTDLLLTEIAECEINVMAEFEGMRSDEKEEDETQWRQENETPEDV